jgi:hypothetical protein
MVTTQNKMAALPHRPLQSSMRILWRKKKDHKETHFNFVVDLDVRRSQDT